MPNFKRIGGGPWKNGQKSVDLTWNDPIVFYRIVFGIEIRYDVPRLISGLTQFNNRRLTQVVYFGVSYDNFLSRTVGFW